MRCRPDDISFESRPILDSSFRLVSLPLNTLRREFPLLRFLSLDSQSKREGFMNTFRIVMYGIMVASVSESKPTMGLFI